MGNIKYQKLVRKYSDDGGLSWNILYDNGKPVYKVGKLLEDPSNCTSPDTYRLEWFIVPDAYICENKNKYEIYVERESYDGKIWNNTGKRRKGNLIEENSVDCGYVIPENNILAFEFSGTTPQRYIINDTVYTATTSPVSVDIKKDLNINEFTSARWMLYQNYDEHSQQFVPNNITKINSIPDTDKVTDMYGMFMNCNKLTNIDLSKFNTSNVIDMGNMFGYCNKLISLDLSNFDTSKVKYMFEMFFDCEKLTSIDLSKINTSNVIDMGGMFRACVNLTNINLTNFNTSNVLSMRNMFNNCHSLTTLDLSNFNTSKVTSMSYMFEGCSGLTTLDLSNFNTSNVKKSSEYYYAGEMAQMFYGCSSLTSLNLSNFDTSGFTNMYGMFEDCRSLETLDLSNLNLNKVSNMTNMFRGCTALKTIYMKNCNQVTIDKIKKQLTTDGIRGVAIITQ